jgi:hypothetical protein
VAAGPYDAVFSANILHIVGWPGVEAFFAGVGRVLGAAGMLVVYGPFNVGALHEREQPRIRCMAESARSSLGHPRCRGGAGPRRAGRPARRRRRGNAGEQPLSCLAARLMPSPFDRRGARLKSDQTFCASSPQKLTCLTIIID